VNEFSLAAVAARALATAHGGITDLAGVLVVTLTAPSGVLASMVRSGVGPSLSTVRRHRMLETVAATGGVIAALWFVLPAASQFLVPIVLPFATWAALRLGVPSTAVVLLAAAVASIVRLGPNATEAPTSYSLPTLLVAAVVFLLVASIVRRRDRAHRSLTHQLRQMRRQLELASFSRSVPTALASLDSQLRITRANDRFRALSPLPADEQIGHSLTEVVPLLADRLEPLCRDVSRTGIPMTDVEIQASADRQAPRIWLARGHRVLDHAGGSHVSLALQEVTPQRRDGLIEKYSAAEFADDPAVFVALAEHVAFALHGDAVVVAQMDRPSGDRVRTIVSLIDGQHQDATTVPLSGTLWEKAAATDMWLSTNEAERYDTLHPELRGLPAAGCLIIPLRDSTSALLGFIAALTREPFADIEAAVFTLKGCGTRAAADMERRRARDDHRRLVSELGASIRELALIARITRLLQHDESLRLSDHLGEICDAILQLWPQSGVIGVRTRLGAVVHTSATLDDHQWSHRAVFAVSDSRIGAIEIAYEAHPTNGRSTLLETIATMLRRAIDHQIAFTTMQEREERYRSVVDHQSDLVCRFRADTTLTFVNTAYCSFFAKNRDQLIGTRFIDLIPEGQREETMRQIEALLKGERPQMYEHPVLRPDGTIGQHQWVNRAIESADGRIEEFQGIGRDITDQRRAEEALRSQEVKLRGAYDRIRLLAQRLILAQEAERTEIARDLHDDVSQQLAAAMIDLSLIEARVAGQPDLARQVATVRQLAGELADKMRHTSHTLHPGVLKHAGLAAALASHCETVAAQHAIAVVFEPCGSFDDASDDVALCLYRVTQQALRNVVMHALATRAVVTLARKNGSIELVVADDGRGFDPSKARLSGIGLMSIEERVSLVRGTLVVDSEQGHGSRLRVVVPVDHPPA